MPLSHNITDALASTEKSVKIGSQSVEREGDMLNEDLCQLLLKWPA